MPSGGLDDMRLKESAMRGLRWQIWGDLGEIKGRSRGDLGEIKGSARGDLTQP